MLDFDYTQMEKYPSVFNVEKQEGRSGRYTVVPTIDIIKAMKKEGYSLSFVQQTKSRVKSDASYAKHLVKFRKNSSNTNLAEYIPEIVLLNSHNGTSSYRMSFGIFRFACANGLVVADSLLSSFTVRHTGNIINNIIEAAYSVVKEVPKVTEAINIYKGIKLTDGDRIEFAKEAIKLKWEEKEDYYIPATELLQVKRAADIGNSLWTTFNIVQEVLLKGGNIYYGQNCRRQYTGKQVTNIDKSLKMNRDLWNLTEQFALLKG